MEHFLPHVVNTQSDFWSKHSLSMQPEIISIPSETNEYLRATAHLKRILMYEALNNSQGNL